MKAKSRAIREREKARNRKVRIRESMRVARSQSTDYIEIVSHRGELEASWEQDRGWNTTQKMKL